jgi:hypothetical protein
MQDPTAISEENVRDWLAHRANQTLLRHGNVISAKFAVESASGPYSVACHLRDGFSDSTCGIGATIDEAEARALDQLGNPLKRATEKRIEAERLINEAARLEQLLAERN